MYGTFNGVKVIRYFLSQLWCRPVLRGGVDRAEPGATRPQAGGALQHEGGSHHAKKLAPPPALIS
jgi:hypothetical protein